MTTCPDCRCAVANYTCLACRITWRRVRTRTREGDWVWETQITPLSP